MIKRIICLILCLILTLGIFGCAKDLDAPESNNSEDYAQGKVIACWMGSIYHPVHRVVQYGFCTKAEELGMIPIVSGLDEGSMQELIDKWNSDIASNNAVGALIWTGDDSCYDMMKSMKTSGVYVTVPNFEHEYMETKDFIDKNIHSQDYETGRNAADFIINALYEKGIKNGSIGLSQNGPGITVNPLIDGFKERISEMKTDFTVLDRTFEGAEITEATNKVTRYINENPDMVAAFGTTGGSPQSWAAAMENTGRTDLIVVGMDYTSLNIELIENGPITAIVCRPLFDEGAACAQALYDLNNGAVFNTSEDTWFEELEAPIADIDDMPYYRDIWQKMYDYFGE